MTTNLDDLDLEGDSPDKATPSPDSPALRAVANLVEEWDKCKLELAKAAEYIRVRSERMREIEEKSLPDSMTEAGVSSFTTAWGRSVKVDEIVRGNIPAMTTIEKARGAERAMLENRRNKAYEFARKHWPGLVKTELSVSLGKGETEVALRIAELLRKQFELSPSIDETIHPGSLNSHFKQLKEDGKIGDIPAETFSLYIGPIAKIK